MIALKEKRMLFPFKHFFKFANGIIINKNFVSRNERNGGKSDNCRRHDILIRLEKYKMKKRFIIAAVAAGIVYYILSRKKTPKIKSEPKPKKHHLTKVFAKAKKHAVNA